MRVPGMDNLFFTGRLLFHCLGVPEDSAPVNRGLLLLCIYYSVLLPEIVNVRNLDKYIVPLHVLPMLQFPIPSIVEWPS